MKSVFLLGIIVVFLNANTNKEYYTLKIIRKNAQNTFSQVFLSKSNCEKHRIMLLKQNSGSGYGYKCVIKQKTKRINGIRLMNEK